MLGQAYHVRRLAVIEPTADLTLVEADPATVGAMKGASDTALAPLQTQSTKPTWGRLGLRLLNRDQMRVERPPHGVIC